MHKKKIAFIVIHGIGQQEPFETMDLFVQGLVAEFKNQLEECHGKEGLGIEVVNTHRLKRFSDGWMESYIQVLAPSIHNVPEIHVYEYYWAHLTQNKISNEEVLEWLMTVARGAQSFYEKNPHPEHGDRIIFTKDGEIRLCVYLAKYFWDLGILVTGLALIYFYFKDKWGILKVFAQISKWLLSWFKGSLDKIESYMGDVTLYTTTDVKSQYYEIRQNILNNAVKKTKNILEDKKDHYDEVVIVGHSLGSVVGYDVLGRLNNECDANPHLLPLATIKKLKGLVTFGSPLDKIAFFFDEKIDGNQKVRRDIVSQLHGFRRYNVEEDFVKNGITLNLKHVRWLNFWIKQDIVCGYLDVYKDVANRELRFSKFEKWWRWLCPLKMLEEAHLKYWESKKMYCTIIKNFVLKP